MHISNPQKATMTLAQFGDFVLRNGLNPWQIIAVGVSIDGNNVEIQYLRANDYPRAKLTEKLEVPVAWTQGFAYVGNIQMTKDGLVIVEGEARFVSHPNVALCVRAFRTMLVKISEDKPIADLYCVTPTHKLETMIGGWDSIRNFQHPEGFKMTNLRSVARGLLAIQGTRFLFAERTKDGGLPTKIESWKPITEVNDRDPIAFLGRVTADKVVATTELGMQIPIDLRGLTAQNPKVLAGQAVKSEDFFYGMTADGLQSTACLTRKAGVREQMLVFAPTTGKYAPEIAAQLQ